MVEHIVILTGAGISAESGLGTFRDKDGLWTKYDLKEVATPQGFEANPELVQSFYNARRTNCLEAEPNAAHFALAELEQRFCREVLLVTQNVDDLHERAGTKNLLHMHGALLSAKCHDCDHRWPAPQEMKVADNCPSCGLSQTRPDIVWFGEIPYHMDEILAALHRCDLFVSIGTSGNVYPAANFVEEARLAKADTLELNLEPSFGASSFSRSIHGPASKVVPDWVASVLQGRT